jgi:signal transduction histidine kinase
MNAASRQSSRGFFWHGVFILLPVIVLATVGLISLRQDRLLAEAEARQNAQRYADEICRAFQSRASSKDASDRTYLAFRINGHGQLIMPPPAPTLPIPSAEAEVLSAEQQNWWMTATGTATDPQARTNAISACEKLLATTAPTQIAGSTLYRLALLLDADGKRVEARRALQTFELQYPQTLTQSGFPLLPLAEFKRLEWRIQESDADRSAALANVCSNLVHRPTFMTPFLLARAGDLARESGLTQITDAWQREWKFHEVLRELARAAFSHPPDQGNSEPGHQPAAPPIPALFWIEPASHDRSDEAVRIDSHSGMNLDVPWLAARTEDGQGGYWIVCRALGDTNVAADSQPAAGFWSQLSTELSALPPWFDCTFQVAGRSVNFRPAPQRDEAPPTAANILAMAHGVETGSEFLRVNVHLVAPELLYARQAARSRWFGLLIATASFVALAGFISARRAFQRQRQLAEMKSNFVSSVSHELRAPIASVRLMAESLDRGSLKDPAKQRDYYKFIVQECRRLGALIENVLDFARIEQGRKEYDPQPTDVAALLQQSVKLMEPAADEKQVKLVTLIPDADTPAHPDAAPLLDGHAIQQALVNLIDNAVKHSPIGATITVGINGNHNDARTAATPNGILRLFVEDRGPGIPPEDRERIFERFYRRGAELRRNTQGVGIGLSIVKHIVEAHGGRVIVEGAVGHGSRFIIELPTKQPSTPNP